MLAVAEAVAPSLPDGWQSALGKSDLAGMVRENDLLGEWRRRAEAGLKALLQAADGPGAVVRLSADPDLRALVEDPRVRALIRRGQRRGSRRRIAAAGGPPPVLGPCLPAEAEAGQERLDRGVTR